MTPDRTDLLGHETDELFSQFGMVRFSFPRVDFLQAEFPDLKRELEWLRGHVREGCLDGQDLVLPEHAAFIDPRPCPQFLGQYPGDENFLGRIIAELRQSGTVPARIERWGEKGEGVDLPENSRFGLSVTEIEGLIIPRVEQLLGRDDLAVRLPTVAEELYMRRPFKTFSDTPDYSLLTREWTSTKYCNARGGEVLGRVFTSGENNEFSFGGVHWWPTPGEFNRLPTMGFRLVVSPKKVHP